MRRPITTFGTFDLNHVCGLVTCDRVADDSETSLRFSQALELLRSCGMEFHVAVPEGQETPRRRWWRSTEPGGSP